eukprot:1146781-Pelagomonas_calceolata.AAC.2
MLQGPDAVLEQGAGTVVEPPWWEAAGRATVAAAAAAAAAARRTQETVAGGCWNGLVFVVAKARESQVGGRAVAAAEVVVVAAVAGIAGVGGKEEPGETPGKDAPTGFPKGKALMIICVKSGELARIVAAACQQQNLAMEALVDNQCCLTSKWQMSDYQQYRKCKP